MLHKKPTRLPEAGLTVELDSHELQKPSVVRAACPGYGQPDSGGPVIAAGLPVEAVENIESLSLQTCFGTSEDIFALEVDGESMIDEDIRPGDYVICRSSNVAHDGQLVVAVVNNENATLKRFYKEKNRARLEPANKNFQPIYSKNCRIEAIVIGLMRKI